MVTVPVTVVVPANTTAKFRAEPAVGLISRLPVIVCAPAMVYVLPALVTVGENVRLL